MRVYRIEHMETRRGAYTWGWPTLLAYEYSRDKQPVWMDDAKLKTVEKRIDDNWRFGFESLCAVYRWFGVPLRAQADRACLAVYEVTPEAIIFGAAQLVFDKRCAQHLADFPIRLNGDWPF